MGSKRFDEVSEKVRIASGPTHPLWTKLSMGMPRATIGLSSIFMVSLRNGESGTMANMLHHLTPFANTPGFTVDVPREQLSSDGFFLLPEDYNELVRLVYTVDKHLKTGVGIDEMCNDL